MGGGFISRGFGGRRNRQDTALPLRQAGASLEVVHPVAKTRARIRYRRVDTGGWG